MPRLMATDENQVINIPGPGNFQFSGTRIENLGASEYTLYGSVFDLSGSVEAFAPQILNCQQSIIGSLLKSPRSANLLHRVLGFNQKVFEIHGFKELSSINPADYAYDNSGSVKSGYLFPNPSGMTALYDATFDAVGAILEYAIRMGKQDFDDINAIVAIVTDGLDNRSKVSPRDIKQKIEEAKQTESLESILTILVALNDPNTPYSKNVVRELTQFQVEAGIDQFVDIGDATPQKLAKLANFVSQSVSSQSQALGTGAPSQILAF
jgi:hypothetical protein